jgi:rhodanese-related sulfurtransferase
LKLSRIPKTVKEKTMAYTEKFQLLADQAQAKVQSVAPADVDALVASGAVALDIRDKEEHDAGHIPGSVHISRGKLEMNVEAALPDLDQTILCYCNAFNRGALSAATLQDMGYKNAKFIAGGLNAYRKLA